MQMFRFWASQAALLAEVRSYPVEEDVVLAAKATAWSVGKASLARIGVRHVRVLVSCCVVELSEGCMRCAVQDRLADTGYDAALGLYDSAVAAALEDELNRNRVASATSCTGEVWSLPLLSRMPVSSAIGFFSNCSPVHYRLGFDWCVFVCNPPYDVQSHWTHWRQK